MSFEVIIAGGFILIVVGTLASLPLIAYKLGKTADTKEEAKDATRKLERHNTPLPDDIEYGARLRRQAERLARLRNRKTKP